MSVYLTPHDRYFKSAMSDLRVAKDFFRAHLPESILKVVDLASLERTNESFVDKNLSDMIVDMLFSVSFCEGKGYLYLLIEHKSNPERFVSFYMVQAQCRIMNYHLKKFKENSLPIIFPILFYNGEKKYAYSLDLFDLFENPALARQCMLRPVQLVDLNQISDEEIRKNHWAYIMEFMMKHIRDREITKVFEQLFRAIEELKNKEYITDYFDTTLAYIFNAAEIDLEKLNEIVKMAENYSTDAGEKTMTLAEQLMLKGEQKGIQEQQYNTARSMLARNMNISLIAELTQLSLEQVRNLEKSDVIS